MEYLLENIKLFLLNLLIEQYYRVRPQEIKERLGKETSAYIKKCYQLKPKFSFNNNFSFRSPEDWSIGNTFSLRLSLKSCFLLSLYSGKLLTYGCLYSQVPGVVTPPPLVYIRTNLYSYKELFYYYYYYYLLLFFIIIIYHFTYFPQLEIFLNSVGSFEQHSLTAFTSIQKSEQR